MTRVLIAIVIITYGILVGGFMNICIDRIPEGKSIFGRSSLTTRCGHPQKWYHTIPLLGYFLQRRKCQTCNKRLSLQSPIIGVCNGVSYLVVWLTTGISLEMVLFWMLTSALIVLGVIDFRTYEIPFGINVFIFVLGVIRCIYDRSNAITYIIGFAVVSVFLALLFYLTKGTAMGGGDVRLMATAGLLLGGKYIVLAFLLGCIIGSVVHVARMVISKEGHMLAFGPYLAIGIWIAALWGDHVLNWYFNTVLGMS